MKRLAILMMAVIGFYGFALAQTNYTMYENTYMVVKSDKYKEFGEAMSKHNEKYHSGGVYHANVWMVMTGQYTGSVVWSMGPCTFTHLDSRPDSEDHNSDWAENVMPHVQKTRETGYWKLADKISYMPTDSVFSKLLITVYDIDDWQNYRFKEVMKKVAEVYEANNLEHSFSVYFPAFDMNYERDAAIVWGFNQYSAFDEDWKFKAQYEELHGEGSWLKVMDEYRAVVNNSIEEIWEFMPDMSGSAEN